MTIIEMAALVARMREAQDAYFRPREKGGRTQEALRRAKELEHLVDRKVAEVLAERCQQVFFEDLR